MAYDVENLDFAPPKSSKRPRAATGNKSAGTTDAADASDEVQEQASAPPSQNRKARRAAGSKARKSKGKTKDDDEGAAGQGEGDSLADSNLDDPAWVRQAILTRLTVAPEVAARAFGIGRNSIYAAIHKEHVAAIRIGHRLVCPTAPLRRQLGLEPPPETPMTLPAPASPPKSSPVSVLKRRRRR
jgi:hypothetical protein